VLAAVLLAGGVQLDRIPFGVVLPDEIAVKEGADTNFRTSFDGPRGLRVRIVDSRSGLAARPPRQRPRRLGEGAGNRPDLTEACLFQAEPLTERSAKVRLSTSYST
jgi:hypothetical protein